MVATVACQDCNLLLGYKLGLLVQYDPEQSPTFNYYPGSRSQATYCRPSLDGF